MQVGQAHGYAAYPTPSPGEGSACGQGLGYLRDGSRLLYRRGVRTGAANRRGTGSACAARGPGHALQIMITKLKSARRAALSRIATPATGPWSQTVSASPP